MKFRFNEIFHELADGSLTPTKKIRVGGIEFGPGVVFSKGVSFAGIDFYIFKGRDIEADEESGILVIKGIYQ